MSNRNCSRVSLGLLVRLLISPPISKALANDALQGVLGALCIFNAKGGTVVVAEVILRQITLQMLFATARALQRGPRQRRRLRSLRTAATIDHETASRRDRLAGKIGEYEKNPTDLDIEAICSYFVLPGNEPGSKEEQIGRKRLLTARSCAFASLAKEEDSPYSTGA